MKTNVKPVDKNPEGKSLQKSSKTQKTKDLVQHAMVASGPPTQTHPMTMDGTAVVEISQMLNLKYSDEIVKKAAKVFNVKKLKQLKVNKFGAYLDEGKKQVLGLWHCIEALTVHTELFKVTFLIAIGKILNDIEDAFGAKSKYMKWLRKNFGHKNLRYFQHAKQLEKMGDFARAYASLGKNRLLEFARLHSEPLERNHNLLNQYPFEDITADHDGVLFKEHVDGIITLHRLNDAGVDSIEFDQAVLMAAQSSGALTVKRAECLSALLADIEDKKQALDDLILNKMDFPHGNQEPETRPTSLTMHFADLIKYSEKADIESDAWIQMHQDQVQQEDLVKVYHFIVRLAERLEINLNPKISVPEENSGERRTS
jgi:hypothetical protein